MSNKVLLYSYLCDVKRMIYYPEPDLSTQGEYTHDPSYLDRNPYLFFALTLKDTHLQTCITQKKHIYPCHHHHTLCCRPCSRIKQKKIYEWLTGFLMTIVMHLFLFKWSNIFKLLNKSRILYVKKFTELWNIKKMLILNFFLLNSMYGHFIKQHLCVCHVVCWLHYTFYHSSGTVAVTLIRFHYPIHDC